MKAIVQHEYGTPDILALTDVEMPEPGPGEVLVRVHAASDGPWVWRMIAPNPLIMRLAGGGVRKPKRIIPGADLAGRVEAIGADVITVEPGDDVYGETDSTFAEFTCASEDELAPMPANLTYEQAAAVPVAAHTALLGLRDHGNLQPNQRVMIIGASGGVGSFAVQIAKAMGAEVTGVCGTDGVECVRDLGAGHVIDYTQTDFTANGQRYDVIFQLGGAHSALDLRGSLTPKGTLVLSSGEGGRWVGPIGRLLTAIVVSPFVGQRFRTFVEATNRQNLLYLTEMIEVGQVMPLIDRTYPLSETAAALRSAEHDHPRGKIVITI